MIKISVRLYRLAVFALALVLVFTAVSVTAAAVDGDTESTSSPISVIIRPNTSTTTEKETESDNEPPVTPNRQDENEPDDDEEEPDNAGAVASPKVTEPKTTAAPTLPEGSFYVYLELGNGEKRLKTVLDKPGLVPEPDEPKRAGFTFAGWYADKSYKTAWDFFTDFAYDGDVIYAKWVADPKAKAYSIAIKSGEGGTVTPDRTNAVTGEEITLTVTPDEGMRLARLLINGKQTDVFIFTMPAKTVTISAEFEKIPQTADNGTDGRIIYICIGVGALFLIAVVFIVLSVRRRRLIMDEPDEIEEVDESEWIDSSAVVEGGFKDGKIIKNPTETPDLDKPDDDMIDD